MTKVQFIKMSNGDEIAVLPREDYERLAGQAAEKAEDAGTAYLVNKARTSIAAGEPLLPKEVVDRLTTGENPIRVFREWRGMTQEELALQGGITQGYLSDLESGRRRGPAVRLKGISHVLKVPLDLLIGDNPKQLQKGRTARSRSLPKR